MSCVRFIGTISLIFSMLFAGGCDNSEEKSRSLLNQAKLSIHDGREDDGLSTLRKLVADYSSSTSAAEAIEIIKKHEDARDNKARDVVINFSQFVMMAYGPPKSIGDILKNTDKIDIHPGVKVVLWKHKEKDNGDSNIYDDYTVMAYHQKGWKLIHSERGGPQHYERIDPDNFSPERFGKILYEDENLTIVEEL